VKLLPSDWSAALWIESAVLAGACWTPFTIKFFSLLLPDIYIHDPMDAHMITNKVMAMQRLRSLFL
jgi:hypothetical protein